VFVYVLTPYVRTAPDFTCLPSPPRLPSRRAADNKIGASYSCESAATLGDLKNPQGLNFSGFVLTDWEGAHSTVDAALAGLDMEMPDADYLGPALLAAVEAGTVPATRLDDMALRVLTPMFAAGIFDIPNNGTMDSNATSPAHNALSREIAAAGTVLLQNRGGLLPLSAPAAGQRLSIAVIGDDASASPQCCITGSGAVTPPYVITPLEGVSARAGPNANVSYTRTPPAAGVAAVAALAAAADVAIVCVSVSSGEGSDRASLNLSAIDTQLLAAVTAAQPRTVVVLHVPGAVVMPWADAAGAIVAAWFPGSEMGSSLADILFGDVNPSGRLPVTFPVLESDTPMQNPDQYPGVDGVVNYTEKLLIGHRWFDANNVAPRFPFGHGLSFSSFSYSSLYIDSTSYAPNVTASFVLSNSGARDGFECPQLYLTFPAATEGEPPRVLRGFKRVFVSTAVGGQAVQFVLQPRDMSIWSTESYAWRLQRGEFTVSIGASSRDIRLTGTFTL
jgi:beta-glucosidase